MLRPVRWRIRIRHRWPHADDRVHERRHAGGGLMSHSAGAGSAPGARHGMRIFLIWLPLAVIADALIWLVWYPHMPPGRMTDQAQGQQFDIAVMAVLAAPVLLFVWVYVAYALIVWR